ncbi:MAG: lamin tail domain-containing protein [Flexilinea sp.]
MSSFWKILLLLLVNVLVSVFATLAVLYYWENIHNAEKPYTLITSEESEATPQGISTQFIDYGILSTPEQTTAEMVEPEISKTIPEILPFETTAIVEVPPVRGSLVTIPQAIGMGDINSEAVRIQSNSDTAVALAGWTLEDSEENIFTFPDIQLIRKDVFLEVYSRSGHDTPFELYWGRSDPVWESGETIVIKDAEKNIQATYRIP